MNKTVERQIMKLYDKVFSQVYNKTRSAKLSKGNRLPILQEIARIESSKSYNEFAKRFSIALSKNGIGYQRGIWRKYYNAAKKSRHVSLSLSYKEFEAKAMSNAVKHNFTMIKTIPRQTVKIMEHKYTSKLIEEVAKGALPRGSFYNQLRMHGHKNAKCIARTETSKLQTSIVETRSRALNSVAYTWLSSNDKRTRPSHKKMNGVIVFWRNVETEKPYLDKMYGNAGEFPNCRCSAQPIVDIDQLTKSTYRVYDYRNKKIITMSKKDLISALQRGYL